MSTKNSVYTIRDKPLRCTLCNLVIFETYLNDMRFLSSFVFIAALIIVASSCNNFPGCTESTADNFDPNAKTDDSTCIPARDKMIGNFTYTRMWTDVLTDLDSTDFGAIQITEANTALNDFNMLFNGVDIRFGSVVALDIDIDPFTVTDTVFTFPYTFNFTGMGTWLKNDSIDMVINLTTRVPDPDNDPPPWPTVPQTYYYYCTKTN